MGIHLGSEKDKRRIALGAVATIFFMIGLVLVEMYVV